MRQISISSKAAENERLKYVLHFLSNHPLVKSAGVVFVPGEGENPNYRIQYGAYPDDIETRFFIPADHYFFEKRMMDCQQLKAGIYKFNDQHVYAVGHEKKEGVFFEDGRFGFDVFETLFFHISRYEEWSANEEQMDAHERMKEEEQFLVKHNLEKEAMVDQLIIAFLEAIGPEVTQRKTRMRVTHDIDELIKFENPFQIIRKTGGVLWRGEGIGKLLKLWQSYADKLLEKAKDPYDTYDWMLKREKQIEKLLYLHVGGETRFDSPYSLENEVVGKIRRLCLERGYTLGVHPSYDACYKEELFRNELGLIEQWLGKKVTHSRQHFLRFLWPKTPLLLEQMGIKEDSSLGYTGRIGYRAGTGFPYQLYHFGEERAFNFLEVPMVLMDVALLREGNYNNQRINEIWNLFMAKNEYSRMITFDFHNSRFDDASLAGLDLRTLYEQIK